MLLYSLKRFKVFSIINTLTMLSLVAGCGSGGSSGDNAGGAPTPRPASSVSGSNDTDYGYNGVELLESEDNYAARQYSPYASVLKDCVLVSTVAESCPVSKLPFLGDGNVTPTIDQIMDRTIVSHNWMALRFEEVLRSAPDTLLHMFSSITVVQISSKVRPSYYTSLTGAIHLDPNFLWTTVDEKLTIDTAPDYREGFGNDLQFWFLTTLRDAAGEKLIPFFSLLDNSVRTVEDIKLSTNRLLFHELTHAADSMPLNKLSSIDQSLSASEAIRATSDDRSSKRLRTLEPLISETLYGIAQVRWRGREATPAQIATTPVDAGMSMSTDGAAVLYGYLTQYEDLAELVTTVLMGFHYDASTNVAFVQKPADTEDFKCDELIVGWGQRNRLADPLVRERARLATELVVKMTPELRAYLDNVLGNVELMETSLDWCEAQKPNIIVAGSEQARSKQGQSYPRSGPLFREMLLEENRKHPGRLIYD